MGIFNLATGKIGIKKLTDADLGSSSSHQTHVALHIGPLSHLPYEKKSYNSQLLFNGLSYEGICFLKFITNSRSPAINMGSVREQKELPVGVVSIGKKIREIANSDRNIAWFLIWFSLDNDEIVGVLLNQNSQELTELKLLKVDLLNISSRGFHIDPDSSIYQGMVRFLSNLVTEVNFDYIEELEVAFQTGNNHLSKRKILRVKDMEQAEKLFKEIGRKGEEALYRYLKSEKINNKIKDFKWLNKSCESYEPYDFEILNKDGSKFLSDAKTTNQSFAKNRPIYLSANELDCINQNKSSYLIHRLYSIDNNPKLKICNNIHVVSDLFIPSYNSLTKYTSSKGLSLSGIKVAVPTDLEMLNFGREIPLNNTL